MRNLDDGEFVAAGDLVATCAADVEGHELAGALAALVGHEGVAGAGHVASAAVVVDVGNNDYTACMGPAEVALLVVAVARVAAADGRNLDADNTLRLVDDDEVAAAAVDPLASCAVGVVVAPAAAEADPDGCRARATVRAEAAHATDAWAAGDSNVDGGAVGMA